MATDATGTPSSNFGFPKLNTADDAPSGVGLNNIVDDIDSKLNSQFVHSTDTAAANEVPVWNGSAFVYQKITDSQIDTAAAISISKLAGYPSDSTKFVRGDGTWAAVASATLTTSLPGSPANGDEIIFTDSTSAPTYYWHLRYNSTTTKWHFIGGSPLFAEVTTDEATGSPTYTDLTTAGPSIALPVAGDYDVEIGWRRTTATGNREGWMSYAIGASTAVDADGVWSTGAQGSFSRVRRKTGLSAVTLTAKYKDQTNLDTVGFADRFMRVTPVKVG